MRAKRPRHVGEASERFVGPSELAQRREDHEALRRFHPHARDDEDLALLTKHCDGLVDLRPVQERVGTAQVPDTRAVISLSRTARSPASDALIRYENSPVWSAGIRRVIS
jgi:hypothetical protein